MKHQTLAELVRKVLSLTIFTLLLTLIAPFALAQETTGRVEGTVLDATGARIPGATVKVEGSAFIRTVTTDSTGFFQVIQVPPGMYKVSVSATNFSSTTAEGVSVVLGIATPLEFTLRAGQVQEAVTITGSDIVQVDLSSSKLQSNIATETLEALPKGVNFSSALRVAPNVRPEPLGAGFQIDGASGAENTFIIDGQEVTNFRTGQLNSNNNIPFDFVQEIQVKSNGFEAEYGGATGGVINVVSKRGNNEFHGNVGIQFENDGLISDFRPILNADPNALSYINPPKDDFANLYPNVTLGGPVFRNRVWFLGSYSVQNFNTTRTRTYPSGESQTYKQNFRRDYGFLRLDAQLADNLNVFSNYTYNPTRTHGVLDSFTNPSIASSPLLGQVLRGAALLAEQGGRVPSAIVNVGGTYTPTSWLVLTSRFGRSYLNEKGSSYGIPNEVRFRCITGNTTLPNVTPAGSCASNFSSIPNNFGTNFDISTRKTFDVDGSILVKNFAGRHQFKVGYQLNKIFNNVSEGYFETGEIRLFYGRTFSGIGAGQAGYGYLQRFGTVGEASSKNQAFYFQDSWQPVKRLTLNLGLRVEKENVPTFSATGQEIVFGWADKPAPRLGGAFDLLGNGKVKVFASYGWFYDRFKYELPRGSFGGDKFLRNYFPILSANPNWNTYTRAYALANSALELDFRVPSNDPSDNRIDPDLDAAKQSEYTIGTEWEVARNLVFAARFTHKQVDRAIEDVGIFDNTGNELYYIANPGYGIVSQPLLSGVPATPKAERKYDALELRLDKRFANNFRFTGSYTYSRLFGNYSGLASSDERGRSSPNVNRFFDLPFLGFTLDGKPENGRLATDRPHVFKFDGRYDLNWGRLGASGNTTEFGLFFIGQSGTPLSSRISFYNAETFLNGRGDLGRTDAFTQTDLYIKHIVKFKERYELLFDMNVDNLFDQDTVTDLFTSLIPITLTATDFGIAGGEAAAIQKVFQGGLSAQAKALIARGGAYAQDARYRQAQSFQVSRQIRLGIGFRF